MPLEIKFRDKNQSIGLLKEMFNTWKNHLSELTENQAFVKRPYSSRSIKDDVAHLWIWQRISVARIEGALNNKSPDLDWWPEEFDPESEADLEKINKWIYEINREKSWKRVYKDWKEGFSRLISLAEKVNENDLVDTDRFSWFEGYPLIAVLEGSYDHHAEHLEGLGY
ncbi:MAG: ClbS/DfsB family four-helix bundle protein [Candidatus Thorarchaeota archaeon]